ncbi:hypothetical protein KBC59_00835 [Patescibacteria group bacterium]|nr:hypothetical protein [Patescibacteria group bacterium]
MNLSEATEALHDLHKDQRLVFDLYQDFRLKALEAAILWDEVTSEKYENLLVSIIENHLELAKIGRR